MRAAMTAAPAETPNAPSFLAASLGFVTTTALLTTLVVLLGAA